jgi:hypothetical protein
MAKRVRDRVECVKLTKVSHAWKRGAYLHAAVYVGANVRVTADNYPVGSVFLDALPISEQRRLKLSA